MIRVTLVDPQQTVSFITVDDIARRLVAGCAANPDTIGELLLATEVFQQGIAAAVMAELMAFDKALLRREPGGAQQAPEAPDEARAEGPEKSAKKVRGAFQVVDERTAARAFSTADGPLLLVDLPQRTISASGALDVQPSGEIYAHSGDRLTDRAITYVLPKTWTLQPL